MKRFGSSTLLMFHVTSFRKHMRKPAPLPVTWYGSLLPFNAKWTSPSPRQATLIREWKFNRILSQNPTLSEGSSWGFVMDSIAIIMS